MEKRELYAYLVTHYKIYEFYARVMEKLIQDQGDEWYWKKCELEIYDIDEEYIKTSCVIDKGGDHSTSPSFRMPIESLINEDVDEWVASTAKCVDRVKSFLTSEVIRIDTRDVFHSMLNVANRFESWVSSPNTPFNEVTKDKRQAYDDKLTKLQNNLEKMLDLE